MRRLTAWLSLLGLLVACGCALAALGGGLGVRLGWWHYRAGITTLANVFWIAAGTAVACAIALGLSAMPTGSRRALAMSLAGLVIAALTAWMPYDLRMKANALPPIHDITTDLANPPEFVRTAALRKPGENPAAYDGPKVGEQQKAAYPDLGPLVVKQPRAAVFAAAEAALKSMGLEIVEAEARQGRIEATATSLLFGFKDDVVVRLTDDGGATKVDVRSKSRVGRNDFGMNAKRIRAFEAKLQSDF